MPAASGLSKRETLERLMAELLRLRLDAREPEFRIWRASVNATMSELFGPGHKLTVALRDVAFTPGFEQGRTRAFALLRAASSLATDSPKSNAERAARAAPIGSEKPDAGAAWLEIDAAAPRSAIANDDLSLQPSGTTEPEPEAVEPQRERIYRRIVCKRDFRGTRSAVAGEPPDAVDEEAPEVPPAVACDASVDAPDVIAAPQPAPVAAAQPARVSSAGPSGSAGPAAIVEPVRPKRETISREYDTSWPDQTLVREFDPPEATPVAACRTTWAHPRASRRPKRGLRRLISAPVIVVLGLAVATAAWLWLFGGWSTMYGLGASTVTATGTSLSTPSTLSPSANAQIVDVTGDPRSSYIVQVVRAGIVQPAPNKAGEVSFLPAKLVGRGELLVWLDRVRLIPPSSRAVPDTFYYDLDAPLRDIAIDAYQLRIVLEWPGGDAKIAFNATQPILARDAEAWAARMIIRLLPAAALQTTLGITEAGVLDLRARISSLKPQELATITEGFKLLPQAGWAKEESITRSEAAEFLMRLKAVFDRYPAA